MAPKKSAFFVFLACHKREEITKGVKPSSYAQLSIKLTPIWNTMTEDEKNKYKVLAQEFNSSQVKQQPLKQISDLQNNSYDFLNMKKHLTEMFKCIPNDEDLLNKKFILLHINSHTHDGEQYYFPAEIAALEFNLKNGIFRTYHQIIGLSKIYPRGYAGSMRQFSDQFHNISCWEEHPDDYQKILLEFSTFLKDGIINNTDLQEGTLDLPYLFTIESEVGLNMMKTKSSLKTLYSKVFPKNNDEHFNSIFKIGSVEQLLLEIKNNLNLHLDRNLRSRESVHDILEFGMYGCGLGCQYHEMRDISYKCSKARICQWMSNICIHINSYTGLPLVPGRHLAVKLKDGSSMIIENAHLPLTKEDLKC